MKKVYNLLTAAALFAAGVTSASARYWTYDSGAVVNAGDIVAGKFYAFQTGASMQEGTNWFLAGNVFTESLNLKDANLYAFEVVEGKTNSKGLQVYYLKNYEGEYLSKPGNTAFYTASTDRAWEVVVQDAQYFDGAKAYSYEEVVNPGTENEATETRELTGFAAYQREARDLEDPTMYDFSNMSFNGQAADHAIVIGDAERSDASDPYSGYNFFVSYADNTHTGVADKMVNYARNAWVLYPTDAMPAKDALEAVVTEVLGEGIALTEKIANYQVGEGGGEYSPEIHKQLTDVWAQIEAVRAGSVSLSDEAIETLADQFKQLYNSFITSGKPLEPGYYIVYSLRSNTNGLFPGGRPYPYGPTEEGTYDDGAIYDGSAVNATDKNLRWSYKKDDPVKFSLAEIEEKGYTYETAKFIWRVTKAGQKDNDGNELFYFQNVETEKYIGKDPARYSPIVMTDKPEVSYTIKASANFPGYFSFYSPALTKSTETGAPSDADYSGIHCSRDVNNVVAWDWRVAGSCWQVRSLTEEEVKTVLANLAQPKLNNKLSALVTQAQSGIDAGYSYAGFENNQKIASTTTGAFGDPDGLVTSADQLASPMADIEEGQDPDHGLSVLLDNNSGTYFHTSWHGDANAWKGDHYLQMTLSREIDQILVKWGKRNNGTNLQAVGAPIKVSFWGTNDPSALERTFAEVPNEETGEATKNFDDWKTAWDSLGVSDFKYVYDLTVTDSDPVKTIAKGVGTAYLKFINNTKYKHIRMAVINSGGNTAGNRYFHGAEFRVYEGGYDPSTSLIASVPEEQLNALRAEIAAAQAELKAEKATQAQIDKLQAAYDAFLKVYPDPTRVRTAIADAKALATAAAIGNDLGYYAEGSVEPLTAVINEVESELNSIVATQQPTSAQIDNLLSKLNAALDAFNAKLSVPQSGIYQILSSSSNNTNVGRKIMAYNTSRKEHVRMGGRQQSNGVWEDVPGFEQNLAAYWQVDKVDGGYTYKNLFTGLYLAPLKGQNVMTQREEPYVFALRYAKFAGSFNLVLDKEDANGEHIYANAQPGGDYLLVTWNTASGNDNSAFRFVPAQPSLDFLSYKLEAKGKGKLQIITFPIAVKNDGNFYTVIGQDAENNIQLEAAPAELVAGQAYVYVPADEEATAIFEPVQKAVANLVYATKEAEAVNGLVPTFETVEIPLASGKFNPERSKVLRSEKGEKVAAATGYFTAMPATDKTGALTIAADGKITTIGGVVLTGKAATQGIYTISGVRLHSTKNLPAGVYIINGKKQVVQ